MPGSRHAPDLRLRLGGAPAPAVLRASVTSLRVESGLEGADRAEVELVNESLRWLEEPLLAIDAEMAVSIGYAPDAPEQVFVGRVVSRSATFPAGGAPTLTVAAQDLRRRLPLGGRVRWFPIPVSGVGNFPLPDPAVASLVAAEHGFVPVVEPVGAALSVILGGAEALAAVDEPGAMQRLVRKQDGESDDDFLSRLCRENGWEMIVDHAGPLGGRTLRFTSPLDHLTPDATLAWGASLLDFTPRISTVGQVASVTAHVWVARIKTDFTITVGWDWDSASLTIDVRPGVAPGRGDPSGVVVDEPVTPGTAPRRIVGELIPRLNSRLTASGSCLGDPRIRAGAVLRIEGVGEQFGGLYRVTGASHAIDGSGYRTTFDARKEIWFGSIPLPEQGAVPVTVTSPLAA